MSALLNYLGETPAQKETSSTPGYLTVGMSCECFQKNVHGLATDYIPIVLAVAVVRRPFNDSQ